MTLFWIIGGGLLQVPLVEEVRRLGYGVIVTDGNPNCPCATLADHFRAIDIFDIFAHVHWAEELKSTGHTIEGVLAAGIDAPETMAELSEYLGLPGVKPDIARLVNNKDQFREKMAEMGLPCPKFSVVTKADLPRINSIAAAIGYPLIIKNSNSSGSRGTKIFRKESSEMSSIAAAAISISRSGLALVESLWEGSEHTVETLFDCDGNFHPCFITDRIFDKSNGYPLETGLIHPSLLPHTVQENMYQLAERVARGIGINIGAAKYDMMMTADGPRIIEMTVRLSGGFDCQYLVPRATGKNILKAAVLTALNRPFETELLTNMKHRVALSESLWPKPGTISAIRGVDEIRQMPGFEHLFLRYQVGDVISEYIDCTKRVCFIIVSGSNLDEAKKNMNRIKTVLAIETK